LQISSTMAKRLIDTSIFRKDFIKSLEAPYKLLFIYLINECDHAGLWDVEIEIAEMRLGVKFKSNPLAVFRGKVIAVDDGKKWFIPSFVTFQYGNLNPDNRAHASVISLLEKFDLLDDEYRIRPIVSPFEGAMDKDIDKDKEMDKEQRGEKSKKPFVILSEIPKNWNHSQFLPEWADFMEMRRRKKWSCTESTLRRRVEQLVELSAGNLEIAIKIMQVSTERGYAEFFPLKNQPQQQSAFNFDKP